MTQRADRGPWPPTLKVRLTQLAGGPLTFLGTSASGAPSYARSWVAPVPGELELSGPMPFGALEPDWLALGKAVDILHEVR